MAHRVLDQRLEEERRDARVGQPVLDVDLEMETVPEAGALHAADEVTEVAERLGAGVAKALLGKAVLPDDLPWVTGSIGLLGTRPSWELMMNCDTLLMIGTSFPYAEFLPKEGRARGVQIDIRPRNLNLRYPMEVALCGDSKETLQLLLPLLEHKTDRQWREQVESWVREWWTVLERRAMDDAEPLNPQRVFWELSPRLPDNCILTCDSGSAANWWARDLKVRRGMMASLSGNLATMGPGVPYAIAAKFAHLGRLDEAHEHFARLLDRRSDLGLLAEEIDPESGEPRGNFPQALSHIGLINAALTLEEKEGSVGQPRSNVPRIAPKTTWAASVTSGVCLP